MTYDINLIPKNQKNKSGGELYFMMLVGLLCATVIVVFFYIFPMTEKNSLNKKIQSQQNELTSYSKVLKDFSDLTAEKSDLEKKVTTLSLIKNENSNVEFSKLFNDIEKCFPEKIFVRKMTLDQGLITIEGNSLTYKEISQFMVKLRKVERVEKVTFTSATAVDEIDLTSNNSVSNKKSERNNDFIIYLNTDITDPTTFFELADDAINSLESENKNDEESKEETKENEEGNKKVAEGEA